MFWGRHILIPVTSAGKFFSSMRYNCDPWKRLPYCREMMVPFLSLVQNRGLNSTYGLSRPHPADPFPHCRGDALQTRNTLQEFAPLPPCRMRFVPPHEALQSPPHITFVAAHMLPACKAIEHAFSPESSWSSRNQDRWWILWAMQWNVPIAVWHADNLIELPTGLPLRRNSIQSRH